MLNSPLQAAPGDYISCNEGTRALHTSTCYVHKWHGPTACDSLWFCSKEVRLLQGVAWHIYIYTESMKLAGGQIEMVAAGYGQDIEQQNNVWCSSSQPPLIELLCSYLWNAIQITAIANLHKE